MKGPTVKRGRFAYRKRKEHLEIAEVFMKSNSWMYVVAVVLLLMAACGLGLGGFIFLGSLGGARVGSLHVILIVLGLINLNYLPKNTNK